MKINSIRQVIAWALFAAAMVPISVIIITMVMLSIAALALIIPSVIIAPSQEVPNDANNTG